MFYLDAYVPPDERFSPKKLSEFIENSIQAAVHFLVPEAKTKSQDSHSFESFNEILDLFSSNRSQVLEAEVAEKIKKLLPDGIFKKFIHASKSDPIKFPLPQIVAGDFDSFLKSNINNSHSVNILCEFYFIS